MSPFVISLVLLNANMFCVYSIILSSMQHVRGLQALCCSINLNLKVLPKFHCEFRISPGGGAEHRWGRLKAAIFDQYFAKKFGKSDPVVAVVDRTTM